MNNFKVGDPVEYVGTTSSAMIGKVGVVVDPPFENAGMVYFDHGGEQPYGAYGQNLRRVTPDVITINRADLPEVTRVNIHGGEYLEVEGSRYHDEPTAKGWRDSALRRLALAKFVDNESRNKKRDVEFRRIGLILKLMPEAAEANNLPTWDDLNPTYQRAIDMIIELQDESPKLPEF